MTQPTFGEQPVSLQVADAQVEVPEWFRQYLRAGLKETFRSVPDEFVSWMVDKNSMYGLGVPIGQVIGFTQFVAQSADRITTTGNRTSATYGDLDDSAAPVLTGLPDGQYVLMFGATQTGTSFDNYMGVKVNTTEATDALAVLYKGIQNGMTAIVSTLDGGGNNTVTTRYRVTSGGTSTYTQRWLIAIKFANS
jgi:hypothetical protein